MLIWRITCIINSGLVTLNFYLYVYLCLLIFQGTSESLIYETPTLNDPSIYFYDHFDDVIQFKNKWVKSQGKKKQGDGDADYNGTYFALSTS